jgi:hypothetical protein
LPYISSFHGVFQIVWRKTRKKRARYIYTYMIISYVAQYFNCFFAIFSKMFHVKRQAGSTARGDAEDARGCDAAF